MSFDVENTIEELEPFEGAKIIGFDIRPDEFGSNCLRMKLRLRPNLAVNQSVLAVLEVWQDVEGNGPGYLSYVGGSEAW